jgi:hypothetical protein
MDEKRITDSVTRWAARGGTVTDPDIIRALKREGFKLRRGYWVKTFNFDPDQDPEFAETWRAEMSHKGELFFRGRHEESGRQRGWSGAVRKDFWPRSLLKYAGRGNQVRRKDKDLMRDTGGVSKGRDREPSFKPPRDDVKNRHREKRLDKDGKKDREKDDREFKKPNRRTGALDSMTIPALKFELPPDGWWEIEDKTEIVRAVDKAMKSIARKFGLKFRMPSVRLMSSRTASTVHPLDRTDEGAWAALKMPEQNYHRQVYSALWHVLESENGISEKDFSGQDEIKALCEKVIRSDEADEIITRFAKQGCRPGYCAESIFDQMRR